MSVTLLKPCGSKPNCVSSIETRPKQHIQPIDAAKAPQRTFDELKMLLKKLPRCTLIEENDQYVRIEVRSRWFGFVDELECRLKLDEHVIHIRGGARTGYSDFGVNRKRWESIRADLQQVLQA